MAKPEINLLAGIELPDEDIAEYLPKVEHVCNEIRKDAPNIKRGLKEIESDIIKTGKAIYEWLAKDADE